MADAAPTTSGIPHRRRQFPELHVAVLLFGAVAPLGKGIEVAAGPMTLARCGIAVLVVAPMARLLGWPLAPRRRVDLTIFGGLGLVLALHWVTFFESVKASTVSVALLSLATFPIFTAVFEAIRHRRRPAAIELALGGLAFAGVAVIIGSIDPPAGVAVSVAWGVASAALFGLLTVTNQALVGDYPAQTVALYQFAGAGLLLVPFFATGLGGATGRDWFLLAVLGIGLTGIPHILFILSMQTISSATASLTAALEPLYGIVLAWLFLRETPGLRVLAGGVLILTAVVLGSRRRSHPDRPTSPV